MTRITPTSTADEISDWIEDQLKEVNLKVEHIIYRLRYEDPRIWTPNKTIKDNRIEKE